VRGRCPRLGVPPLHPVLTQVAKDIRIVIVLVSMPLRWRSHWLTSAWRLGTLLPLAGLLFWLATGWINQRVLSQTQNTTTELQAVGQHQVNLSLSLTIVSIDAEIDRSAKLTELSIRAIGSPLEEMEFKFPVTEFAAIEQAIAQELDLSVTDIHSLIRYRIND
jgi:hypothetical protein